jgi:hypothetical protein
MGWGTAGSACDRTPQWQQLLREMSQMYQMQLLLLRCWMRLMMCCCRWLHVQCQVGAETARRALLLCCRQQLFWCCWHHNNCSSERNIEGVQ